ncbi:hypothetical protein VISI1226_12896 [Vibrio sinaloensis DSM 21326]|uniref:ParD-like antitoxin of type II toxin-antitoxin system n=2 Tax=Photobacterium sp. (strain ATCC 43367) TaxID=379097 RepID=E8M326_PHOS4|nr:hypothetical protein VISI1226_12896 [Vibrio sinaloensis DSM 21326]
MERLLSISLMRTVFTLFTELYTQKGSSLHRWAVRIKFDQICDVYIIRILNEYGVLAMGIVKISDELHEELRKASSVMSRSINSQAEFWIKIGMLAELHPQLSFNQLVSDLMKSAQVSSHNLSTSESVAAND